MSEQAKLYCQSCGMPLEKQEDKGSNKDGSKSEEYCSYCLQEGAFTEMMTMEEMIELCLNFGMEEGLYTDRDQAKQQMLEWFPSLKRWRTA